MIVCSNCQHQNVSGAMFCAECGAQLDGIETLVTQAITDEQIAEELKKKAPRPDSVSSPGNSWLSLHLMDSGKILPLASRNEFTLGRLSEGQFTEGLSTDFQFGRPRGARIYTGGDCCVHVFIVLRSPP